MIATILGLIALGLVICSAVALTTKWIIDKIKSKKQLGYIKKVFIADIKEITNSCNNTISLNQLNEIANSSVTHVMADIDESGNIVGRIEEIRDTNQQLDEEVEKLLGRDGMVVVEVE